MILTPGDLVRLVDMTRNNARVTGGGGGSAVRPPDEKTRLRVVDPFILVFAPGEANDPTKG